MQNNIYNNLPIGVFDSGMGGLTVLKSLIKKLPNENFIYFGDTARLPYGTKSTETIINYSEQAVIKLLDLKVKMIIIACNSATVSALEYLKSKYIAIPIIGVVEPGAIVCANTTKTNNIGIIATERTIQSGCYEKTLQKINPEFIINTKPCNLLVSLAEEGHIDDDISSLVISKYIESIILSNKYIDTLLLGCTHFPVFHNIIKKYISNNINIVDSADTTAKFALEYLEKFDLLNSNQNNRFINYYVTDSEERFKRIGELFLGQKIDDVTRFNY